MRLHPSAAYWDVGIEHVPSMTGAATLLDAHDIREICAELAIPLPLGEVLDIGCGTGRAALVATRYVGVDIAPSAVAYCARQGLEAHVIAGAADLDRFSGEWLLALSLFTHMSRDERRAYLGFMRGQNLLADIIPGDGGGAIGHWTADADEWLQDLEDAGYAVLGAVNHVGPDHVLHRYYRAARR